MKLWSKLIEIGTRYNPHRSLSSADLYVKGERKEGEEGRRSGKLSQFNFPQNLPNQLTHRFCPSAENTVWVRKVRLVSKVRLATKALKFEVPVESEKPPHNNRRECEWRECRI